MKHNSKHGTADLTHSLVLHVWICTLQSKARSWAMNRASLQGTTRFEAENIPPILHKGQILTHPHIASQNSTPTSCGVRRDPVQEDWKKNPKSSQANKQSIIQKQVTTIEPRKQESCGQKVSDTRSLGHEDRAGGFVQKNRWTRADTAICSFRNSLHKTGKPLSHLHALSPNKIIITALS